MQRVLIHERIHQHIGDMMRSPSAFRRLYEEEKGYGNEVTLLPGFVLHQLADGEVHYIWRDGCIVAQVYAYRPEGGRDVCNQPTVH